MNFQWIFHFFSTNKIILFFSICTIVSYLFIALVLYSHIAHIFFNSSCYLIFSSWYSKVLNKRGTTAIYFRKNPPTTSRRHHHHHSNVVENSSSKYFCCGLLALIAVQSPFRVELGTPAFPKLTTNSSFSPKKINNFLGKLKLNFWTKNEDFEHSVVWTYK